MSLGERMQGEAFVTVTSEEKAAALAKVELLLVPTRTQSFDPSIGQSIRLAQIASEYLLGRMTKTDHDNAWDRILNFRRPQ